jgi:putative ubiquitin-RnfH superfamily antitoxin RatB of RatAB toxin-antitoxin module
MARAESRMMSIEVVYCPQPGHCDRVRLSLPEGSSVADAVAASGLGQRHGLAAESIETGIWGRKQLLQTALRDRDRVELYRPLRVDPKEARRLRYKRSKSSNAADAS